MLPQHLIDRILYVRDDSSAELARSHCVVFLNLIVISTTHMKRQFGGLIPLIFTIFTRVQKQLLCSYFRIC